MREDAGNEQKFREAEASLREFFARADAGEGPSFEQWCAARAHIASELRELHAACGRMVSALAGPSAQDPASAVLAAGILSSLAEHPGRRAAYEVGEILAQGGMGEIRSVYDRTLRRELAMKLLRPGNADATDADPRRLARFVEEAQVTAQLDHPGIVPVHDLGLDSDGRVYFTMKLVKGRDLRQVFEQVFEAREGWNETRALGVILKVCEAMAYAHSKGVIHRDLKPANVMVGSFGEVYVMDWGLARVLGKEEPHDVRPDLPPASSLRTDREAGREEAPDSPLFTMDGDVVGTPAYMPPEQALGQIGRLGAHSDVYAIGALLYHLLARRMPYVPRGADASSRMVLLAVTQGPPAPVHSLRKDVPDELVAICEKAMAREPERRYANTQALAEDLRAYLEHRVVTAHQTGALVELRKWIERNRKLAAALAGGILALAAGLASSLVLKAQSDRHALRAEEEADDVLRLSAARELEGLVAEADALWPARAERVDRYREWLSRARALVAGLDPSSGDEGHRARLAELRARALPATGEERLADRLSHPRLPELELLVRRIASVQRAQAVREGRARLEVPALEGDTLSLDARRLNELAWPLVAPDRASFGDEATGLALARLALTRVPAEAREPLANFGDTLAWACFANGLDEEALAASSAALEAAPDAAKEDFRGYLARLRDEIERARSGATLAELDARREELETEVSSRRSWTYAASRDAWWDAQLAKLIQDIEAFADAEQGLVGEGLSPEHGWGVARRLRWASEIVARTVSEADAAERWTRARASIANPTECPFYRGLEVEPQVGLLPLGRDPTSGLWEFAHLETGEAAVRRADGTLTLGEGTGLVFVLLPGGAFWMGAQSTDPGGRNHDPAAGTDEGPVHEVHLSPFFLSKYEMTQGQWMRVTGANPSLHRNLPFPALHPVEAVSWAESRRVLSWLGLLLPSEAQWEYGARAGTTTVRWTGDETESLFGQANMADRSAARVGYDWLDAREWPDLDDGHAQHAVVDSFRPNPFGLHNVLGNVWELCLDGKTPFYSSGPERDPVAPARAGASIAGRGGGFNTAPSKVRSANRDDGLPGQALNWLGLRPARIVDP